MITRGSLISILAEASSTDRAPGSVRNFKFRKAGPRPAGHGQTAQLDCLLELHHLLPGLLGPLLPSLLALWPLVIQHHLKLDGLVVFRIRNPFLWYFLLKSHFILFLLCRENQDRDWKQFELCSSLYVGSPAPPSGHWNKTMSTNGKAREIKGELRLQKYISTFFSTQFSNFMEAVLNQIWML